MSKLTVIALVLFVGCSASHPHSKGVRFGIQAWGLDSLTNGGSELSAGGYYVIGACVGHGDGTDPGNNVQSRGGDGTSISAPGNVCPPSPLRIQLTLASPQVLHSVITVGPLGAAMSSVSVPFDLIKGEFTTYQFPPNTTILANNSMSVLSNPGAYSVIPLVYPLPDGIGFVGVADPRYPVGWIEASGPHGHVRRMIGAASNIIDAVAINHPSTNNLEVSWGAQPKGAVLKLEEDLYVY